MPSFEVCQLKQVRNLMQIHEQSNLSFSNSIAFAGCDWVVGICEAAVSANLTHMWIKLHIDSPHVNKCIGKLDLHKTDNQCQRSLVHVFSYTIKLLFYFWFFPPRDKLNFIAKKQIKQGHGVPEKESGALYFILLRFVGLMWSFEWYMVRFVVKTRQQIKSTCHNEIGLVQLEINYLFLVHLLTWWEGPKWWLLFFFLNLHFDVLSLLNPTLKLEMTLCVIHNC